jgi:chaperonin cofactor prefoldin
MALKKRLKKLDEVDEKVRGLYVQQGDEFVLDLDDPEYAEMRKKVEEFRTNNIQLSQQREQLEAQMKKFEGIDPGQWQEAKKALDTINQIEEKDLIKGGKFDEVVNRRLQAYRQDVEKQTKDLNARIESLSKNEQKYRGAYAKMKVETEVGRAIQQAASIRQGAMDDVMNRVQRDWNVNDKDELLVKDLYDEDGKPLSPDKYAKHLIKSAPHLFEAGTGGGAGGGNKQRKKEAPATVRPDSMGITTVNGDTLRDIAAGKVRIGAPVGASSDDGE